MRRTSLRPNLSKLTTASFSSLASTGEKLSTRDDAFGHPRGKILRVLDIDANIMAAKDLHLFGIIDLLNLQSFELAQDRG